jgi:hypothetical protein
MVEHVTVLAVSVVVVIVDPVSVDPVKPVVRSIAVDRLDIVIREDTVVILPVSVE